MRQKCSMKRKLKYADSLLPLGVGDDDLLPLSEAGAELIPIGEAGADLLPITEAGDGLLPLGELSDLLLPLDSNTNEPPPVGGLKLPSSWERGPVWAFRCKIAKLKGKSHLVLWVGGYKSPEQIGSSNRIGLTQRFFWSARFEFFQSLFQSIQRATTPARLFRRLALATASRSPRRRARRQPGELNVDRATRISRSIYFPAGVWP